MHNLIQALGKQRYLCFALIGILLIGPLLEEELASRLVLYGLLGVVIATGPVAVARSRRALWISLGLAFVMIVPGLFSDIADQPVAYSISTVAAVAFFGHLAVLLTKELLFDVADVDEETLWGAVNVYLLIGLCFAFMFAAVSLYDPQSFVGKFMDQPLHDQIQGFVYFSFVTMTTLGYGDITPNNTLVATFAYVEAVIGQLYIAIMIARLVGLYIAKRR
ncbi:MAG: ion channel [Gammaproteobacteria bacterium]|nr:ion channel [Gammaproteobacteria bacterium]